MTLRHRLAHALGSNLGAVEVFWWCDVLWVGFRCDCGELRHVDRA